jgi:hypothetical protein
VGKLQIFHQEKMKELEEQLNILQIERTSMDSKVEDLSEEIVTIKRDFKDAN